MKMVTVVVTGAAGYIAAQLGWSRASPSATNFASSTCRTATATATSCRASTSSG